MPLAETEPTARVATSKASSKTWRDNAKTEGIYKRKKREENVASGFVQPLSDTMLLLLAESHCIACRKVPLKETVRTSVIGLKAEVLEFEPQRIVHLPRILPHIRERAWRGLRPRVAPAVRA
jgi:hypothetical protein